MKTSIYAFFSQATGLVLSEIGFSGIGMAESRNSSGGDCDLLAAIGLTGGLKGHFIVSFDTNSADAFVACLYDYLGLDREELADQRFRKSALAEIANQIGGRASALLAESGIDCMITPPTVISGQGVDALLPGSSERARYQVSGDFGVFDCVIALK